MSESARQISLGYQPHLPARRMLNIIRSNGSAIQYNPVAGTTETVAQMRHKSMVRSPAGQSEGRTASRFDSRLMPRARPVRPAITTGLPGPTPPSSCGLEIPGQMDDRAHRCPGNGFRTGEWRWIQHDLVRPAGVEISSERGGSSNQGLIDSCRPSPCSTRGLVRPPLSHRYFEASASLPMPPRPRDRSRHPDRPIPRRSSGESPPPGSQELPLQSQ